LARRAVLIAVLALALPGGALADGDPASDYLLSQNVFFPLDGQASLAQESALMQSVRDLWQQGLPLRVAIIGRRTDLGSVPVLYRQPRRYAKFLGQELSIDYRQRLLVVMPNGYGLWRYAGPVPPRELAAVAALRPPGSTQTSVLIDAAGRAVRRLAALHGIHLAAPTAPKPAGSTTTRDRLEIVAAVLLVLAVGAGIVTFRRVRQ
jgi:hypothetical protein